MSQLPDSDQAYWHAHEIQKTTFSEHNPEFISYVKQNFNAELVEVQDPIAGVMKMIVQINSLSMEEKLFRSQNNPYLSYPVNNTHKSLCDSCSELYKLIGPDNLNQNLIKNLLIKWFGNSENDFVHKESGRPLSSLQLLEKLTSNLTEGHQIINQIRTIQELRVEADHKITIPSRQEKNYIAEFGALCQGLASALVALYDGLNNILKQKSSDG